MSWVIKSYSESAYWISPDLELFNVLSAHGDWIKERFELEGWEGESAYNDAIDEGWVRMIFGEFDSSLLFEAKDLPTITKALESLPPSLLSVRHIYVDSTADGKTGEITVGPGEDALSAWKRGVGKIMRGITFVATDDIEMAIDTWKINNIAVKQIIGRDEYGIWWDDEEGSTHLTKWDEIRAFI